MLAGVLRNLNLSLESSNVSVSPTIEVVILCSSVVYKPTNKSGELEKGYEIKDFRFDVDEKSLNQLITDLQEIQKEMSNLKALGELTNNIISEIKTKKATP